MLIEFPDPVLVSQIIVRFQGGFAGKECSLQGLEEAAEDGTELLKFYPKDISSLQVSLWLLLAQSLQVSS